jgi:hypothetical protein
LAKLNSQNALTAQLRLARLPDEEFYTHDHRADGPDILYFDVYLVFTGDINIGYSGYREIRNEIRTQRPQHPLFNRQNEELRLVFKDDPSSKSQSLASDAGWAQRLNAGIEERNSLRETYQTSVANNAVLHVLIGTSIKAAATAQTFVEHL